MGDETLSVEEYLNKIRQYLKDIINNLKEHDTYQIQLTIANNVISSLDNDVELELMKGSEFIFDYVHLLYYKLHKIYPNCGESYIDSPDWIKIKKATINPINKKDDKWFQYTVTAMLNYEEIKKRSAKDDKN